MPTGDKKNQKNYPACKELDRRGIQIAISFLFFSQESILIFRYLTQRLPVGTLVSLHIYAVLPESQLLAHAKYGSKSRLRSKVISLDTFVSCACLFNSAWVIYHAFVAVC